MVAAFHRFVREVSPNMQLLAKLFKLALLTTAVVVAVPALPTTPIRDGNPVCPLSLPPLCP